ncbi:hypothetical protein K502DRAFT_181934 [Neoconidiobolus thromboides FSU 785]|nr:hypothetical protein K502DRAFT_181934 [Neoconidiobolus thromboides FSU 785]
MKCLKNSMEAGSYIGSKRIYIHPMIWNQNGIRVSYLDLKMEKLEILSLIFARIQEHWKEDVLGIQASFEELESIINEIQDLFSTKFDYIPKVKKTQKIATVALMSIANKISKSVDRIQATYTKEKQEESNEYTNLMIKFFESSEFLEEWYNYYHEKNNLESNPSIIIILQKIQRIIEFLDSVIVRLISEDLSLYLTKYFKRTQFLIGD